MLNKDNIFKILKDLGLKNNDNVLIHSSLKNIGEIEGKAEGLIEALKEYFCDGLIILPSHTWSFMNQDEQVLNLDEANSCTGVLANIALKNGFIRSFHPTHSVVVYGNDAKNYIKNDDSTSTPVSPLGCFGRLHEINAKILFLGAKLSKNTFIHSIEEKYNVSDRFTEHKYHLYSKKGEIIKEYYIHKHYSTLNPHISENYMKLEKPMIELNIASYFKFGDADSIIVNSKKCYDFVSGLLEKDRHIFDLENEIDSKLYK